MTKEIWYGELLDEIYGEYGEVPTAVLRLGVRVQQRDARASEVSEPVDREPTTNHKRGEQNARNSDDYRYKTDRS